MTKKSTQSLIQLIDQLDADTFNLQLELQVLEQIDLALATTIETYLLECIHKIELATLRIEDIEHN